MCLTQPVGTTREQYAAQVRNSGVTDALVFVHAGRGRTRGRDVYLGTATMLLKSSVERQMRILTGVEVTLP